MGKKSGRLNDTAAIKAPSVARAEGESISYDVSVRKIENGYVMRMSRSDNRGYTSVERFSKTTPKLTGFGEPELAADGLECKPGEASTWLNSKGK